MKSPWLAVFVVAAIANLCMTQADSSEPDQAPLPTADGLRGNQPGEIRSDNGLGMKLVWCPPGVVRMEDVEVTQQPAATPKAAVANDDDFIDPEADQAAQSQTVITTTKITQVNAFISRGYWIGKFEVTQPEWKQVMATKPWSGKQFQKESDDIPVTWVTWDDAIAFCRKLTDQERKAGRLPAGWEYTLPTEAQWERACRARTETVFSFGDDARQLGDYAWFRDNALGAGQQFAHPVGQKKPNPWGLYDMHGNVFEWCRDAYAQKLPGGRDPETTVGGSVRIFRGGSWCVDGTYCRSADRSWPPPQKEYAAIGVGFRVALSTVQPAPVEPTR